MMPDEKGDDEADGSVGARYTMHQNLNPAENTLVLHSC